MRVLMCIYITSFCPNKVHVFSESRSLQSHASLQRVLGRQSHLLILSSGVALAWVAPVTSGSSDTAFMAAQDCGPGGQTQK